MQSRARHSIIAREGWSFVVALIALAAGVHYLWGPFPALPLWLGVILAAYVFRQTERRIPVAPLAVVCPVDGRVARVSTVQDGFLEREAVCIGIEMNRLGTYSAHSPIEGKVVQQWFPGRGDADDARPEQCGEGPLRYAQWIRTDEGDDIVLSMSRGIFPRQFSCYVQSGERIGQGHRCGYIPFGARFDVWLPPNCRVEVEEGQNVRAGSDVLARLVHG